MKCRLLTAEEFRHAEDRRQELATMRRNDPEWLRANNATYGWASLHEITGPAVMWYVPWYFDPNNPEHKPRRDNALKAIAENKFQYNYYLSRFYWQDWSDKRPPICVLTPHGKEWCVDAKSSNGEGWRVTGEAPLLSVTPSIDVPGYHGWLGVNGAQPGEFSAPL